MVRLDERGKARSLRIAGALAVLLVLVAVSWPLALHPVSRLLGDPEVEAIEHLWTLWLASREGPLVIDTDLASFPYGYRWVLADPLDLLWFAPAALASPVLGFHAVLICNLLLSGLTAAWVGRLLLPGEPLPTWAVACLAIAAPTLSAHLVTGMTEAGTLWAGLLAAAMLAPAVERGGWWVLGAALAGGLAAWAGPYTAVYAALLAPLVLGARLPAALRSHGLPTTAGRLAAVVAGAALLAAPVAWAIATQRPAGLPGAESLLGQVLRTPEQPLSRYLGADPLHVLLPLRPAEAAQVQATWLGTATLALAVAGLVRRRAWLLGAILLWAIVLGMGVYLQVAGEVPRVGGRLLLLPAGLLSLVFEPLGRAARWHRMLTVAALVVAPLAVAGVQALVARLPAAARRPALAVAVAALVAELLLLAPLPWPRPSQDAAPPPLYAALDTPGAVIAVPKQPLRVAGLPRSPARQLLWQTAHGRPIAEKPMFQRPEPQIHALRDALRRAALRGDPAQAERARRGLADLGYAWIVHHDEPGNPVRADQLRAVLGEPQVEAEGGLAWRLR